MRHAAIALLFLILLPLSAHAEDYAARVVGITDGDTLTVLKADKTRVKIRLWGIDAPETGQDFGTRAKQAASELAFGKDVTIRVHDTDRYGRTVAEVILPDGKSLNREMVRGGMAWRYVQYAPKDRELSALEAEAREAKRGLWSQPNPTPPWEWRHPKVADSGQVVGNRHIHVCHAANCPSVAKLKAENCVAFQSAVEAEKAGYQKAGDCRRVTGDCR